jgi:hypothetical protein
MKITPGIGVGRLVFGMSREAVRKRIGLPDSIEDRSSEVEETIEWVYEDIDCSLYFDVDADPRLTTFESSANTIELAGHRPIGMREDEAIRIYSAIWAVRLEENYKELGRRVYDLVGTGVWLWFQDGRCTSVQGSVITGQDDEYAWPVDSSTSR